MTERKRSSRGGGRRALARVAITCLLLSAGSLAGMGASPAWGQVANPVYVDDAPAALDTLLRVRDHLATGNLTEAARVLQVVLLEMPDRLVSVGVSRGVVKPNAGVASVASVGSDERDLFASVRSEAHRVLTGNAELLERYRQLSEPEARARLDQGRTAEVERSYLLTPSGYEAALRVAQQQMEDARFHAAMLTLRQLEKHPDRSGANGAAAGALAQQVARYLDEQSARELASRWSGAASAGAPVAWPLAARIKGTTPLDTAAKADLGAVLGKPLRSVDAIDRLTQQILQAVRPAESERLPPLARNLLVIPTVADDTLYLNDGLQVTAWDRITLAPRWMVRGDVPTGEDAVQEASNLRAVMRGTSAPEDPTTVTVSGRTAIAPLGLSLGTVRWPDPRVVAIDTLTGKVKWSVAIEELDPALAAQTVRGPAVVSEGTVVLALRASLPDRRMVTLYQAGLDLGTGRLVWQHLLGSTGALPYRNEPYVAEAAEVREGIVYHADMLGVMSATEAATGRPVWVRRMPPLSSQTWDAMSPWQIGEPVVMEDSVIGLSPDHRMIVRLDAATGELKGSAPVTRFGTQGARYLVRIGDSLAVVFDNRIALAPIADFEKGVVRQTPLFAEPGINGRVTAAGSRLLVPVVEGVMVVDAENAEAPPTLMPLDSPGNVLALESQLLVVDDLAVHSYLLWEVAEKLLTARMAEAPADPTAAATLAELAYRAGRHERIVDAADAALRALSLRPEAEEAEPTRARLFASLQAMVTESLETNEGAVVGGEKGESPARITADALLGELVERMRRAAKTGDERLAHMLSYGRLLERRNDARGAMDTYQKILDDEALAGSTWAGPRLSTRGELEVTRRMETLIERAGAGVYETHEAAAAAAAGALGADARPEIIVRLATRYPVAGITASLWERAAEAYKRAGRDHAVVGAMESALQAAERVPGGPRVGEVAGRLIGELELRQQYAAAGNALKNVLETHPGVSILMGGQPVDPKELTARLSQLVAARQRWPKVGELKSEGVQILNGWAMMEPIMRVRSGVSPRGVVLKSAEQLALFTPNEATGGGESSSLVMTWKRTIDTDMYELVRIDSEAAYFFYASAKGALVEKVSQSPAALKWQTQLFADVPTRGVQARPGRREMEPQIPTPQDGMALLTDGVISMDDRTMVFLERQGYATALDTQSGAVLWTTRSPLDRVYDAAVMGGTLVVAGDQEAIAGDRVAALRPEIVVLDARTGQEIQRLPQRWGGVRWVRMTDSGQLIAGCENAIVSTDLSRGQVNWVLSDPHLATSRDAWVFRNSVFVLDRDRNLWWADAQTGQVSPEALQAPRGKLEGVRRIEAYLLGAQGENGEALVAFSTHQGLLVYDLRGVLRGVDAVGSLDGLIPPAPASDRMVTIGAMPDGRRNDRDLVYNVHVLDTRSAMVVESVPVVLPVPPRTIGVLDGRVLITAGGTTLVVPAPSK